MASCSRIAESACCSKDLQCFSPSQLLRSSATVVSPRVLGFLEDKRLLDKNESPACSLYVTFDLFHQLIFIRIIVKLRFRFRFIFSSSAQT
jgi:hypothetical protein